MFEKRVEKSTQWITENEDSFQNYQPNEDHDYHERTITDGLILTKKKVFEILKIQINFRSTKSTSSIGSKTCGCKFFFLITEIVRK